MSNNKGASAQVHMKQGVRSTEKGKWDLEAVLDQFVSLKGTFYCPLLHIIHLVLVACLKN